jgi:hypothetical protein
LRAGVLYMHVVIVQQLTSAKSWYCSHYFSVIIARMTSPVLLYFCRVYMFLFIETKKEVFTSLLDSLAH